MKLGARGVQDQKPEGAGVPGSPREGAVIRFINKTSTCALRETLRVLGQRVTTAWPTPLLHPRPFLQASVPAH